MRTILGWRRPGKIRNADIKKRLCYLQGRFIMPKNRAFLFGYFCNYNWWLFCPANKYKASLMQGRFFIQVEDLVYHQCAMRIVYHLRPAQYIITRQRAYSQSSTWWYTSLRLDEIQAYDLMIYKPTAWWDTSLRLDEIPPYGGLNWKQVVFTTCFLLCIKNNRYFFLKIQKNYRDYAKSKPKDL